jgi:hypothetical protein
MTPAVSKYRCQRCGFEFERKRPGMVTCHQCGNLYIDWLNWEEVIASLGHYYAPNWLTWDDMVKSGRATAG